MKRPRLRVRSRCWIPLGVLLLPPLAWTLLLAVLPTGWARARVVARLEAVSGRVIGLEGLRVGVCGGLTLTDLSVAAPATPTDPWLKIGRGRLDVSLAQLLFGRIDPSDVTLDGLILRVHRREDGTLEFADSITSASTADKNVETADADEPPLLQFRVTNSRLTLLDDSTGTQWEITNLEGGGIWEGKRTTIENLSGTLNGGQFELASQLDRSGAKPAFEAHARIEHANLDPGWRLLGYVAPVVTEESSSVQGKLDLDLYVRGQGTSRDDFRRALVGQGTFTIDPVQLTGAPVVAELARELGFSEASEVGAIRSNFVIKDARVSSANLTLTLARFPLVLTGWTDFDGRLDYRFKAGQQVAARLSGVARELLSRPLDDARSNDGLALTGDVGRVVLTLDGKPLGTQGGAGEGRERTVRDLARRARQRLLR